MRGLEELPEVTKNRILPVILFAPWVGSNHLKKSWERFETAFDSRPFFLDLDEAYDWKSNPRPAGTEFSEMLCGQDGVDCYFDFVASIPTAIPVLRLSHQYIGDLDKQITMCNSLARGFLVRVTKSRYPDGRIEDLTPIFEMGLANYTISIDAEWTNDIIETERWMRSIFDFLTKFSVAAPIIISMSSFPKHFSDIEGVKELPNGSRLLFNNIRRRYSNMFEVFYGDWGTTKPRDNSGGRTPPARIDYALSDEWVIFRNKDKWDYLLAAKELVNSRYWQPELKIWGTLMIEKTAAGDISGITTPAKNVAMRVNVHLHRQAWFDQPVMVLNTDDPWDDDL
jgi:hypothetical protein